MKGSLPRIIGLFLVLSVLCSCEYLSSEVEIVVETPELPDSLRSHLHLEAYRIEFLAPDRSVASTLLDPEQRRVAVSLPKLGVVPVRATAVLDARVSADRLVAGGLFPESERGGELRLSWEDGPLASFLLDLFSHTDDECWCNLSKLTRAAMDATDGNPWNLDFEALEVAFECRSLSHSIVREAKTCVLEGLLPEGVWCEIDPLRDESVGSVIAATPGCHLYIDTKSGAIAELFVAKRSWVFVLNRDPETSLSGIW